MNLESRNYNEYLYDKELKKYLKENINKNEIDFLNYKSKEVEDKINYYKTINDEQIKEYLKTFFHKKLLNADAKSIELFFHREINNFKKEIPLKLTNLDRRLDDLNIKSFRLNLTKQNQAFGDKKKNSLLINGKKPNISERYKIANEIFNIYETINKMKISATEKHILLAHILGCNQQTARELYNGTQLKRTPIREDIIKKYLDSLK